MITSLSPAELSSAQSWIALRGNERSLLLLGPVTRRKLRDETRSRWQVTRRDETRDDLVDLVSRPKVTRRDDIRVQVKKKKKYSPKFYQILSFCAVFFLRDRNLNSRPSRETKSRDETRSRWSRLVSTFFETRPSRFRPYLLLFSSFPLPISLFRWVTPQKEAEEKEGAPLLWSLHYSTIPTAESRDFKRRKCPRFHSPRAVGSGEKKKLFYHFLRDFVYFSLESFLS